MLLFGDKAKAIRIFRVKETEEGVKRVHIGSVQKAKLEIGADLKAELSLEELQEVKQVIDLHQTVGEAQRKLDIARFPEIVRVIADYVTSEQASELEKRVIATALTDAIRQIRKNTRDESVV